MSVRPVRPHALALPLAIALGLAAPNLHAEEAAEATHRERRSAELDKVEVVGDRGSYQAASSRTATRTDTPLVDLPQSITVIPQAVIRDQAMQGVGDSLRYVPGAGMAQGEGNRDTPIFRGTSSTADLFVDGMRDDVQYFRDLYDIESVEVLKGPNAMAFGRGGTGGLLNRVSKRADWRARRDAGLQLGSWDRVRATLDIGGAIDETSALRVNAMAEESGSFRDGVEFSRRGIHPTLGLRIGESTGLDLGLEHFEDERTADRGVPSWQGRPVDVDRSLFFGDPDRSRSEARVDALTALLERDIGEDLSLRSNLRLARYDKFYQNVYASSAGGGGTTATISAYNNATQRDNLLSQTDLAWHARSGRVGHTVLAGLELGRQETGNFRQTGYFPTSGGCPLAGAAPTSATVALSDPRYDGPVCFQQSVSDADNHGVARTVATYLQDQIEFSPRWQAILGLRHDLFEVALTNQRTGLRLDSRDSMLSPRAGLVFKPAANASLYANYSLAFQPRSGEQLASLSASSAALEPERFRNLEVGAKWDPRSDLSLTLAAYRLARSNVAVVDPDDATRLVLLPGESQRVEGVELGISGRLTERWSVIGGLAWQDAIVTRDIRTSASNLIAEGTVLPQVPRRSFSLWNRYELTPRWGLGLGVSARSQVQASTSNAVQLPGYARIDAALFWKAGDDLRLQLNIENLADRDYFASAHNDNNISPGSPRAFSLGLHYAF